MRLPVNIDKGRYRKFGKTYKEGIHNGHDFDCPVGTYVKCICNGVIVYKNMVNGFGGMYPWKKGGVIVIKHTLPHTIFYSLYGHVNYLSELKAGDKVAEGDIIGYINDFTSNNVVLPHLHFSIWNNFQFPPSPWGYVNDLQHWVNPHNFIQTMKDIK